MVAFIGERRNDEESGGVTEKFQGKKERVRRRVSSVDSVGDSLTRVGTRVGKRKVNFLINMSVFFVPCKFGLDSQATAIEDSTPSSLESHMDGSIQKIVPENLKFE